MNALARARRAAHEHVPLAVIAERPDEQQLEPSAARPTAAHAGRDHAGVVQNDQVVGAEEPRKVGDAGMTAGSRRPVEHQEAGIGAVGRRLLGDQLRGQRVVQVGQAHPMCLAEGAQSGGPNAGTPIRPGSQTRAGRPLAERFPRDVGGGFAVWKGALP